MKKSASAGRFNINSVVRVSIPEMFEPEAVESSYREWGLDDSNRGSN
jgi:hypothetical protein